MRESLTTHARTHPSASVRATPRALPCRASGPDADARRHAIGLALIHLLTDARLAEFHAEVELLRPGDRTSAPIAFPLRLETFLMEGAYNKVLSARAQQPSAHFSPFMDRLAGTVREQIADCAASSYASLSLDAAQRMMKFDSSAELAGYLRSHRPEWTVDGSTIHFLASTTAVSPRAVPSAKRGDVDPHVLLRNALQYAVELERIV